MIIFLVQKSTEGFCCILSGVQPRGTSRPLHVILVLDLLSWQYRLAKTTLQNERETLEEARLSLLRSCSQVRVVTWGRTVSPKGTWHYRKAHLVVTKRAKHVPGILCTESRNAAMQSARHQWRIVQPHVSTDLSWRNAAPGGTERSWSQGFRKLLRVISALLPVHVTWLELHGQEPNWCYSRVLCPYLLQYLIHSRSSEIIVDWITEKKYNSKTVGLF